MTLFPKVILRRGLASIGLNPSPCNCILELLSLDFFRSPPAEAVIRAPKPLAEILAVTYEPPKESGRPVTHWTPRERADEVVQRGIVHSISSRQVGALKGALKLDTKRTGRV